MRPAKQAVFAYVKRKLLCFGSDRLKSTPVSERESSTVSSEAASRLLVVSSEQKVVKVFEN